MWVAGPDVNPGYGPLAASVGFGPTKSCTDPGVMARYKAMAAQPGSPINYGIGTVWKQFTFTSACRLLPPLNATAWEALGAVMLDPRCEASRLGPESMTSEQMTQHLKDHPETYFCIALNFAVGKPTWNHLLGGAVAKVPQTATAYPWRKAISPLCFDSGISGDMFEADGHTFKASNTMDLSGLGLSNLKAVTVSPVALAKAIQDVQAAYLKAVYKVLGEDTARHAYLNYQTTQVEDYAEAYFGPNYKRLQQIKAKWDPEGFFSKPFTVQPAKA